MFTGLFFTEAAVVIDIFCIRYLSSGPKRALYHRLFSNVPSIRCLSTVQTKKPTIQDIRFTIVFPRFFPTKLTIVMLIGIRHCQVSTNYCDNDCMFVMFISSSRTRKNMLSIKMSWVLTKQVVPQTWLLDAQYVAKIWHQPTRFFMEKMCDHEQQRKF